MCRNVSVVIFSVASGCSVLTHSSSPISADEPVALKSNAAGVAESAVDISQWQDVPGYMPTDQPQGEAYPDLSSKELEELDNMYYTDQSNFADLFDKYEPVTRHDVIFANDSMNLGSAGKARVRAILPDYDPQTDIVSLIGCSHGKTSIESGNQTLALERVRRLQQELTNLGIDKENIFSEGCWAPVHFDEFPRRGVVVSILRQKK